MDDLSNDSCIGEIVEIYKKFIFENNRRMNKESISFKASRLLTKATDKETLEIAIKDVLREVTIFSNSDRAYILLNNNSTNKLIVHDVWQRNGIDGGLEGGVEVTLGEEFQRDIDASKGVLVAQEAQYGHHPFIKEHNYKTILIDRFVIGDGYIGYFVVEAVISNVNFDELSFQLIQTATDMISLTIDRLNAKDLIDEQFKELVQAQKMETVGHLAGGIAHDFNNILAGIVSVTSIFKERLKDNTPINPDEIKEYVETVENAGSRATDVVQHLLGISRKQDFVSENVELNSLIRSVVSISKHSFHQSISLDVQLSPIDAYINADKVQLEQVLLNLFVNAVHSMTIMREDKKDWGGVLSVKTEKVSVDKSFRQSHPIAFENEYWCICIKDNGVGIAEENRNKIFDPFFTTKEKGIGTGLGLSMIYRIIQEHYGFVEFDSEVGVGTEFRVYMPAIKGGSKMVTKKHEDNRGKMENIKILVVDDEPLLRKIAAKILHSIGHEVISVGDGAEAIEVYKNDPDIKLVILDLIMPIMSGKDTYLKLKEIDPNLDIVISSGFRKDKQIDEMVELGISGFLQKPYTIEEMKKVIGEVLAKR